MNKWGLRDSETKQWLSNKSTTDPGHLSTRWTDDLEGALLFWPEEKDEIAARVKNLNFLIKLEWVKVGFRYEVWELETEAID